MTLKGHAGYSIRSDGRVYCADAKKVPGRAHPHSDHEERAFSSGGEDLSRRVMPRGLADKHTACRSEAYRQCGAQRHQICASLAPVSFNPKLTLVGSSILPCGGAVETSLTYNTQCDLSRFCVPCVKKYYAAREKVQPSRWYRVRQCIDF